MPAPPDLPEPGAAADWLRYARSDLARYPADIAPVDEDHIAVRQAEVVLAWVTATIGA